MGCKHAKEMMQYAEDAAKCDKPWRLWEAKTAASEWGEILVHPQWHNYQEYRRKPRTININDFEVPEALKQVPRIESIYYLTALTTTDRGARSWMGMPIEFEWLNNGICHATEEAAALHAKALLSFTKEQ